MPKKKQLPLEERVPAALIELGGATAAEMVAHLGRTDREGRSRIYEILWGLVESGRAAVLHENLAAGFFPVPEKPARGELQAKLRRAVRLRDRKYGTFTVNDLMALAQTRDRDYTKRVLRHWWDLGLVLSVGLRGREQEYCLAPGVTADQLPHWNRRKADRGKKERPTGGTPVPLGPVERAWGERREKVKGILDEIEETLGRAAGSLEQGQNLLAIVRQDLAKVDVEFVHQDFDRKLAKKCEAGLPHPQKTANPKPKTEKNDGSEKG